MARPPCCRRVAYKPACEYFKPQGVPAASLEEVVVGLDEIEAIRLADLEGLHQEDAALRMGISRATFARVVEVSRRKVAEAIVKGKALKLEGGPVMVTSMRRFCCSDCRHDWEVPHGTGRPGECPQCHSRSFHRAEGDRGCSRHGDRKERGQGCCHGQPGRGSGACRADRSETLEKGKSQ